MPHKYRLQCGFSQEFKLNTLMNFKTTRRFNNKGISPLGERNITPDANSKYTNGDTIGDSYAHAPSLKEFSESPACTSNSHLYGATKGKSMIMSNEDYAHYTLSEINLELDNNMNEIIFLLGKRKTLTALKRRRIREEMEDRLERARSHQGDLNSFEHMNDEEFLRIVEFCPNTHMAIKILGKVMNLVPELRGPRADEEEKSESFWGKNRQLENQMDSMLEKLKSIDKNLEKQNHEVNQICKNLDHIEDKLKTIAGVKGQDHVEQVEPLFKSKKKNYDALHLKVNDREKIKDMKIEYIKRIRDALNHLKMTRENRLNEIAQFFGMESVWDFEKYNFKEAGDFTTGFEELMKIKEKERHLEVSEHEVLDELESLAQAQEHIYNQLLRKQSDEAKAYHNYSKVMNLKIKYASIVGVFGDKKSHQRIFSLDPSEVSRKFKDYKSFLKRFMEEDSLIKQGLVKTNETSETFGTLLRATENEKERRHELLSLLEAVISKRVDYEHKKEDLRNLMVQMTKNEQQLTQYEEQLDLILSDGDIEGYKQIGNSISKCDSEKNRLHHLKERIEKDLENMDREVVGLATRVQEDYEDILCQIVPSDYEYSLKNGDDVKRLRNHLRKMYKRLGILKSE